MASLIGLGLLLATEFGTFAGAVLFFRDQNQHHRVELSTTKHHNNVPINPPELKTDYEWIQHLRKIMDQQTVNQRVAPTIHCTQNPPF